MATLSLLVLSTTTVCLLLSLAICCSFFAKSAKGKAAVDELARSCFQSAGGAKETGAVGVERRVFLEFWRATMWIWEARVGIVVSCEMTDEPTRPTPGRWSERECELMKS